MSLSNTKEKSNGSKLSRLLIDGGTEVLWRTFNKKIPPAALSGALHSYLPVLTDLRRKKVLNKSQWDKLFPPGGVALDSKNFDITLLFILLRNICGLLPPSTGWDKLPSASDTTLEANLARIKYFRNEVYGHISSTSIEDSKFESYWKDISSALVALGLDQNEVDSLKYESTSTDYFKLLEEWTVQDQDLKEAFLINSVETCERLHVLQQQIRLEGEKTHSAFESLAEKIEQRGISAPSERSEGSKILSKFVKYDFPGHVESLCNYRCAGTREWILDDIQHHISSEEKQVIVITGKPGVGKSVTAALTCQAMKEKDKLAACHFIEHNNCLRNTPKLIVESLASQLCESVDGFKENLEEKLSLNKNKELHDMNCNELFTLLFEEPLNAVSKPPETVLIVIDALDEIDQSTKDEFVKALFRVTPKLPKWIKLVVTTRPMPNFIPKMPNVAVIDIEICCNNKEDINLYLLSHLQKIYPEETREKLKTAAGTLCDVSDGIFLFAHFAVDMIEVKKPSLSQIGKLVPINISSVYEEYLNRVIKDFPTEEDLFFRFLEALVASEGRLPKSMAFEILKINGLSRREKKLALRTLSYLFPLHDEYFTVFHKSLIDWLSGSDEELHDFVVSKNDGHRVLAPLCFQQFQFIKSHENVPSILNECEKYTLRNGFDHMLRAGGFKDQLKLCVTDLELLSLLPFACNELYGIDWLSDKLKSIVNHLKLSLPHLEEFLAKFPSDGLWFGDIKDVFEAAINCSEENKVRKQAVHLLGTPKYHHLRVTQVFDKGWKLPSESWRIYDFSLSLDSEIALCIGKTENRQSFLAIFNTESRTCIVNGIIKEPVFCCAVSSAFSHPVAAVITVCEIKLIDPKTLQTLDVIETKSNPESNPENDPKSDPERNPESNPESDPESNPESNPKNNPESNPESNPRVCCFLSQGGQLAVGYRDCIVRIWDISTLKLKTALTGHTHMITLCLPLPGNRLLTGDWGGTLLLWQSLGPVRQFVKVTDSCYNNFPSYRDGVAISPDQTKIAVVCGSSDDSDRVVNLFSADDGKMLIEVNLNFGICNCICFIDNRRLMCLDPFSGEIIITNAYSGEKLCSDVCFSARELKYINCIYRINKSELEFVGLFYYFPGGKPIVFRLYNYNVV